MTITLPDLPETAQLTSDEMRLELACALYSRGRVGKVVASEMAGVNIFSFQRALQERAIPLYTEPMFATDLQTLKELFPR